MLSVLTEGDEMIDDSEQYLVYASDYRLNVDGDEPLGPISAEVVAEAKTTPEEKKKLFVCRFFNQNAFRHIALLAGAGTSVMCGGKIRDGLWDTCEEAIKDIGQFFPKKHEEFVGEKDIESFLSYAIQYEAINKNTKLAEFIGGVKRAIRQACTLTLSGRAHEEMMRKLTARKSTLPRVEIFTTNYDTLFEQAARNAGTIIIDGFSFWRRRTFSGRFFDLDIVDRERTRGKAEENYLPNVIHLHKLHGSLDWISDGDAVVQREVSDSEEPLIIYPSKDKYAESYDQPYFEMMARFQSVLRKKECLLIVAGYGFGDKHINSAIIEAVRQNPSFHLLILDFGGEVTKSSGRQMRAIDLELFQKVFTGIRSNITIIQGDFAGFVEAMPLNQAYRIEELVDSFANRGRGM